MLPIAHGKSRSLPMYEYCIWIIWRSICYDWSKLNAPRTRNMISFSRGARHIYKFINYKLTNKTTGENTRISLNAHMPQLHWGLINNIKCNRWYSADSFIYYSSHLFGYAHNYDGKLLGWNECYGQIEFKFFMQTSGIIVYTTRCGDTQTIIESSTVIMFYLNTPLYDIPSSTVLLVVI